MELETMITILTIIGIDIILGGDNAVVIAMASKNLPKNQRNKAIFWGSALAVIIRTILTVFAVIILQIPYLKLVGGLLLIGVAVGLIFNDENEKVSVKAGVTLSSAISTIVFADLIMGLDNVLAVAGAANENYLYVLLGLAFSVPIIISGSKVMLFLLDKVPFFMYLGAGIIAYTAGKMIAHDLSSISGLIGIINIVPMLTVIIVVSIGILFQMKNVSSLRK